MKVQNRGTVWRLHRAARRPLTPSEMSDITLLCNTYPRYSNRKGQKGITPASAYPRSLGI